MNNKFTAILMASIMVLVGFAGVFAPSEAVPDGTGTATDPVYIVGSEDIPYAISAEIVVPVSMNAAAFDSPTFTSVVYQADAALPVISESSTANTNLTVSAIDTDGNGTVTVPATASGFYLIKFTVSDDIGDYGTVELDFYYAVHVVAADDADKPKVKITEDGTAYVTAVEFQLDTNYAGATAKVIIGEAVFDQETYDFYETGLPDGIDMKSDGTITGKISATYVHGNNGTFYVYAVDKNTGSVVIASDELTWTVIGNTDEAFNYAFGEKPAEDDGYTTYAVAGYGSVKNTDDIVIYIKDLGENTAIDTNKFAVKYSLGDDFKDGSVTAGDDMEGTVTISDLDDYTGIVQVQITETTNDNTYTATIHVMVVGPVVHSGLAPAVRSA